MNRAAFDFAEIDVVARERFESGEQRAGSVGELHRDRHFACVGGGRESGGVGFAAQQDEAREIFGVVLDFFGQDDAFVVVGGAASGDGGGDFVATAEDLAQAEEAWKKVERDARENKAKAKDIEDAIYDIKAVNPNRKSEEDTRTPAELLDFIESKGREADAALARLRALIARDETKPEPTPTPNQ